MDTQSVLKRAAEKCGAVRHRYSDRNVPTSSEDVTILAFFGDRRSSFILSSLLLRRIREELKGSRYFILLSWPGHEGLYPYVDEYWQVEDESSLSRLLAGSLGFGNSSDLYTLIQRGLNQFFFEVMSDGDILEFYSNGLTKSFFERFKHVKVSFPSIPSTTSLGSEVSRRLGQKESKVFIQPCSEIFSWHQGAVRKASVPREFWLDLVGRLTGSGFYPVVFSDRFSYDISPETAEKCLHLGNVDIMGAMSAMRSCGCVLDFFGDVSRWALAARTPFLCFEERPKFNHLKEYEINDLCGRKLRKDYIFGFGALISSGDRASWNSNLFDHMLVRLNGIYEGMDRESWPSPAESNEIVPYDSVRKMKSKKMGSRFIRIEK